MSNLNDKNVGILCGGWSDEREVSLDSGKTAYKSLKGNNINAFLFDYKKDDIDILKDFIKYKRIDIVLNLIHGIGGEDGHVQDYLDRLGVKYIGSNAKSSSISFNKVLTKEVWIRNNLDTPRYLPLSNDITLSDIEKISNDKFILKPVESGSSVGIKIFNIDDFRLHKSSEILDKLLLKNIDSKNYFIEEFINAAEYTAPIINGHVFPIIKIETKREFYNYKAKYIDKDTIFSFPDLPNKILHKINLTCMKAFNSLGCSDWGRVDFFMNDKYSINLIEINSIPGMTSHSLVPKSAKKNGISYYELLLLLLKN
ncbi:MAG: D-alanine--D-alanine ligase [Gammaproteobacteria bacterium]|jgi:D-alanine-D-alanine ligase|nr:D-alanine--D-alanine ligase [Gammaproteobacteria bacterium]MBT4462738.1 D-alanine--D-alanine ligase [Gammaproteobacteria bacterium]MBT4654386.1 D-alanine--D-alanine ligase [Gammaproteobacteria bacterium]MBT5117293.1 D-alanine--D-alanine ligase [Gammaproteobacteria bacterium]MBT5761865.1 D-alanine--D-alanine ligase [Gammaproteobacteria bacterium]